MPYSISWKAQGFVLHFFKEITKTDVLEAIGELVGNSMYDSCKYRMFDFSKATDFIYTFGDLKMVTTFAKQAERWNRDSITLFISSKKQLLKHIDLYVNERKSMGMNIKLVNSLEEAEDLVEDYLT